MDMNINPGVYDGISNEDYHAGPGISKSGLDLISRSPFHYYSQTLDPDRPPRKVRAGQLEGTLAHCAILEPDEFSKRYVVIPEDAPRRPTEAQLNAKKPSEETVAAIAYWNNFNEENAGKTVITLDQYLTAWEQSNSVRNIPDVKELLSAGVAEQSAYWFDESGVLCRCRPDWVHPVGKDSVILVDVKTYSSADPQEFCRQVARKRYHVQDSFYSDGFAAASGKKVIAFVFVTVETEWPYAASASMLDEEGRELGRTLYRSDVAQYAKCIKENSWPGYSTAIELIELPRWCFKD